MLDKEADELIRCIRQRRQVFHPVGAFIIFDHDRADIVEELVDATSIAALIPGGGRTGIGSLEHLLVGKDKAHAIVDGIDLVAPVRTRPAGDVIAIGPAIGRIGKGQQIIKVDMGYGQGIATADVQDR